MTEAEVASWMIANGVPSRVADEAGYIATKYGPGGESDQGSDAAMIKILEGALPGYMQRELSGGDRSQGGYNTNLNDPAVTIGGHTAPARDDSNPYGLMGSPGADYPDFLPYAKNSAVGYSGGGVMPRAAMGQPVDQRWSQIARGLPGAAQSSPYGQLNTQQLAGLLARLNQGQPTDKQVGLERLAQELRRLGVL